MKLGQYLVWEGGIRNYGTAYLIIAEHKNSQTESSCCVVFQEWSVPDFRERRVWTGWKINREEYRSDNSSTRFRRQGVRGVYSFSTVCAWLCYHRFWGMSLVWYSCSFYGYLSPVPRLSQPVVIMLTVTLSWGWIVQSCSQKMGPLYQPQRSVWWHGGNIFHRKSKWKFFVEWNKLRTSLHYFVDNVQQFMGLLFAHHCWILYTAYGSLWVTLMLITPALYPGVLWFNLGTYSSLYGLRCSPLT